MGKLKQGKPEKVYFHLKNTGEFPLLIKHIEASCGCTKPEWPKYPIKSGKIGKIKVTYDAKYPGLFVKSIKVFCNTKKGMVELKVGGVVK